MKKLICVICVVLMLFCAVTLTACSGNNGLNGTYKLVELTSGGQDMTSYLSTLGDVFLTIDGNKATIELNGETSKLTVNPQKMVFIDETGEETIFTVEGNRLSMENTESNSKMVFEKQTATADSATADSK